MPEQEHWYAATEDHNIVADAPRKRDVLSDLDSRHETPGLTRRIRSGLYEVAYTHNGDTHFFFIASESAARAEGWNP